jgi:thiol-disulfide isomerase/thioredoxin
VPIIMIRRRLFAGCGFLLSSLLLSSVGAAQPTVRQALGLVPMQEDVAFDRPSEEEIDKCTIQPERQGDQRSWVVADPAGNVLRRFTDTNGDNKIDQWCYFQHGIEVYRDIDADFNEKADQYRWFATGGLRWGIDRNEDGRIDDWKWISPEEVTSELVRAMATQNADRFAALLITPDDLKEAGLAEALAAQITQQTAKARQAFADYIKQQKVTDKTQWVDFSAPQPGVVPAGGEQTSRDVIVYENVIAMTETEGQHGQLPVGTLIKVGESWRLIGLPSGDDAGFFFAAAARPTLPVATGVPQPDAKTQELVQKLEELDKQLASARGPAAAQQVYQQRVAMLRELAKNAEGDERDMWLLQMIDSAVAISQPGQGSEGAAVLAKVADEVAASTQNKEVIAQAKFAFLTADYSESLQQPEANLAKIQTQWIDNLEGLVADFSGTRPAAEAMLQLAISEEFAGEDKSAIEWYTKIVEGYPDSDMSEKARGAIRRLDSVGKPLELRGKGLNGTPVDLAELRGNVTVVHYWATWCEPCKQDMEALKQLLAQYGRRKFKVVGVNLDDDPQTAVGYLQQQRLTWPQLHEAGGLESGLAKQLGVFTLPVMLLVDEQGRVANRSLTTAELEAELKKRLTSKR